MPTRTFFNLEEKKRQRIIDAAIKEFGERNLCEANISNIVKDAAISRGSFYQYFSSKEDIYIYLFTILRYDRKVYTAEILEQFKIIPFFDFFKLFYLKNSQYLLDNYSHISLGKHLYTCSSDISKELILKLQSQYNNMFLIGIEHDKSKGLIREDIDSSALTEFLVHICTDIFIFQNAISTISIANIEKNIEGLLSIIKTGTLKKSLTEY